MSTESHSRLPVAMSTKKARTTASRVEGAKTQHTFTQTTEGNPGQPDELLRRTCTHSASGDIACLNAFATGSSL